MDIGSTRHRVAIETPGAPVPDGDGGWIEAWTAIGPPWDAAIAPVSARDLETLGAGTVIATASHVFRGRYRAGVTTAARVSFTGRAFLIVGVRNVDERGIWLELFTKEAILVPSAIRLTGFRELTADLVALPTGSRADADGILRAAATGAAAEVAAQYPVITGALRDGVAVVPSPGPALAAVVRVESNAPHAHLYEFGSVHQPPRATFKPITDAARRAAVEAIADQVEARGLVVEGARD